MAISNSSRIAVTHYLLQDGLLISLDQLFAAVVVAKVATIALPSDYSPHVPL